MKTCDRTARIAVLGLLGTLLLACDLNSTPIEYHMGQAIEMGPYTFEVDHTEEGERDAQIMGSDNSYHMRSIPEIQIIIRVDRDDAAPFTTDFSSFFAANMKLADKAGNKFDLSPSPVSPEYRGGRYHSSRYVASVRIDPSMIGVRDVVNLGQRARDFRMIIKNPAPQGNQPRLVSIRLQ